MTIMRSLLMVIAVSFGAAAQ
ncbi:MAG: hypothetical protein JWN44_1708, partial [Myxococcales bacterium]|nr:hypothetical protein [Myxococcales bacterium]